MFRLDTVSDDCHPRSTLRILFGLSLETWLLEKHEPDVVQNKGLPLAE
jgi:hypothetical protein